jgi:hypothetical protein
MKSKLPLLLLFFLQLVFPAQAQENIVVLATKGTGRTTGHIATFTVTNRGQTPVTIQPQTFYIPSGGLYQSYVGRIPEGQVVPPGETVDVPVHGYCTDAHTPPVPSGENMPPIRDWIPVATPSTNAPPVAGTAPTAPEPMNPPGAGDQPAVPGSVNPPPGSANPGEKPVFIVPTTPVEPFDPTHIPGIIHTPGYHSGTGPDPEITVTWPGTDTPVGGTIDPSENPRAFVPVIVGIVEEIARAAEIIQAGGIFTTPFGANPEREREAIVQQTIWITMGTLTGEPYTIRDFGQNVYTQFENNTGKTVESLPEADKEKIDTGVEEFWNAFTATGVEAKVLKGPGVEAQVFPGIEKDKVKDRIEGAGEGEGKGKVPGEGVPPPGEPPPPMAPPAETACICDSLSFRLTVRLANSKDPNRTDDLSSEARSYPLNEKSKPEIDIDIDDWREGDFYVVTVNDITVYCHCQNGMAGNGDCPFYAGEPIVTNKDMVELEEIEKGRKNTEVENLGDEEDKQNKVVKKASKKGNSFRFKVTPKQLNNDKVSMEICISASCQSNECAVKKNEVKCERCFVINFKK